MPDDIASLDESGHFPGCYGPTGSCLTTDCAQARVLARWQAPDRSVMERQNAALLDAAATLVNECARETARALLVAFTERHDVADAIVKNLDEGDKAAAIDLMRRARRHPGT